MKKTHTSVKKELAAECGITRPTLDKFLKEPGWPKKTKGGWPIEACQQFILEHTEKDAVAASLDSDVQKLRKWDIYERARERKLRTDQKEGHLINRQKGLEVLGRMADRVRREIEQKLCNEYPSQVVGLEIPQARVFGKRLFDSIMVEFQKACEEWRGI